MFMIAHQEELRRTGPTTLTDLVRNLDSGMVQEGIPLSWYVLPEQLRKFTDQARTIEQDVRSGLSKPEGFELVFIDDFWREHNRAAQIVINAQLNLDRQESPVHTRQIFTSSGKVDVAYRSCPGLAPVTNPDGTVFQWYFRRVNLPEGTNVLSISELSDKAFARTHPDQLVLRRQFPQPQQNATAS